jgi:Leucine-rich repeat (LRR) protein
MNKIETVGCHVSTVLGKELVELNLDFNKIVDLNGVFGSFKNIYNIKKLSLTGNSIESVKAHSFVNCLRNLEELNLGLNQITEIEPDDYKRFRCMKIKSRK